MSDHYFFFMLTLYLILFFFFFSSRRRHTRCSRDWSSDVCSSDLLLPSSRRPPQARYAAALQSWPRRHRLKRAERAAVQRTGPRVASRWFGRVDRKSVV